MKKGGRYCDPLPALLDGDDTVLSEHAPLFFVGAVDGDEALWGSTASAFDVRERLEEAILGADGTVVLLEGDGRELGAFGGNGFDNDVSGEEGGGHEMIS